MGAISIFKCVGKEVEIISDSILEGLNISYEESNKNAYEMAILAKALKEYRNEKYCKLPFCHTVEAEAFGSKVIFDQKVGNRIEKYKINDINLFEDISEIDLNMGRIAEVLRAINILKKNEENVILNITGPFSVATSIMDSGLFYRSVRKNREKINKLLEIIESSIVEFILAGIKQGVDFISFADPVGTMDIVGPKIYKDISGQSTYNILKRVESRLGKTIIHICGKTSTSLEAIGLIEVERIKAEGQDYLDIIKNIKEERKDIKFIGHWCLNLNKSNGEIINCKIK
ncbi:uroporphyrinogen decarboxylase family protein [Tissierella sp. MB52-C2]|uniref:uroporphyrinogen decarboxylase family protein n=1 Tax=Tissierella sp. MB52-C2 TaxID=3070999 RepID=UPI00280B3395|nr:uroporphyrinogen decarboxylase family protein [Tissierella sp. MB52-C2]WMM24426.1 uroporphyrinogen decarboxylase family protein [Tissierella sp. MB52-C2]